MTLSFKRLIKFTGVALCLFTVSCAKTPHRVPTDRVILHQSLNELEEQPVPGTVRDVWAEKMVNQIRVPGQIDPKGVYYRKPHETLIEVRPGRYQQVQFPQDRPADDRIATE